MTSKSDFLDFVDEQNKRKADARRVVRELAAAGYPGWEAIPGGGVATIYNPAADASLTFAPYATDGPAWKASAGKLTSPNQQGKTCGGLRPTPAEAVQAVINELTLLRDWAGETIEEPRGDGKNG